MNTLHNRKIVIVTGFGRSGTTLLASMLGGHKDISILNENYGTEFIKLCGTKYIGSKMVMGFNGIRLHKRGIGKLGHLINRIVSFGSKKQPHRMFPLSKLSLTDYHNMGAKIIIIYRNETDVIESVCKRAGYNKKMVAREFKEFYSEMIETISEIDCRLITYQSLISKTEETLTDVCGYLDLDYDKNMINGAEYNNAYNRKLNK